MPLPTGVPCAAPACWAWAMKSLFHLAFNVTGLDEARRLRGLTARGGGCAGVRVFQASGVISCSIAPNTDWPFLPFTSMRRVSPHFMKRVEALPLSAVSSARFSAMQL